MPQVPIRQLAANGGMNRDQTPNSMPPNVFSDAINARYVRNRVERFGGTQVFSEAPSTPELTNARAAFAVTRQGAEGIFICTATAAYITINGTSWLDVTPAAGWADTDTWTLNQYGDTIWVTSLVTQPFVLVAGATDMVPFTNWPAGYEAQRIVAYKNILVAFGIEISNQPQSGLVIWSDVVAPGDVVDVNWDPSDPTSVAGENVLSDRDGEIRDGGVLRDSLMLYTDSSMWRVDLSSVQIGVTPATFNFRKVFDDDGIFANRCFIEAEGKHYVVGRFDFYVTDGFNRTTLSDNRCTEFLFNRIGANNILFVSHYQRPQEVVISFGVDDDTAAREALVYNYFYDTFTRWNFGGSGVYTHLFQGPDFAVNVPTFQDWQDQGVRFSDLNSVTYNSLFPQSRDLVPFLLGKDKLYRTDVGGATSSVTPSGLRLERRDLDLDEVFGGASPIKYISRFVPLLVGEGTVRIQFGGRNSLSAPIVWEDEREYRIGTDYKFDVRFSARYPSFRILQDPSDGTMALDGFDFFVHAAGLR